MVSQPCYVPRSTARARRHYPAGVLSGVDPADIRPREVRRADSSSKRHGLPEFTTLVYRSSGFGAPGSAQGELNRLQATPRATVTIQVCFVIRSGACRTLARRGFRASSDDRTRINMGVDSLRPRPQAAQQRPISGRSAIRHRVIKTEVRSATQQARRVSRKYTCTPPQQTHSTGNPAAASSKRLTMGARRSLRV